MKPPIWETVYYDSADYWMLVSFMTLEPEQQLQYFEYPPLNQNDKDKTLIRISRIITITY